MGKSNCNCKKEVVEMYFASWGTQSDLDENGKIKNIRLQVTDNLTLVTLIQSIQLLRKLYPNLKQSIF
jgi:hypothetical protein